MFRFLVYITFLFRKIRVKLIQCHFPNPKRKCDSEIQIHLGIPPLQNLRILITCLSTVDEYKVLQFLSAELTQVRDWDENNPLSLPGYDIPDINQNHFWERAPKYLGLNHSTASMNMHALGKAKYSWKHKTVLPLNKNTLFIPDRLSKHTLNQVKTVLWNSWLGHIWRIFG